METTTYPAGYDPNSLPLPALPHPTSSHPPAPTSPASPYDPNAAHHLDHPVTVQYVKGPDGEMINQ